MDKPKILSRKSVYRSPWVNLYLDDVLFPGGKRIRNHHCLDFGKEGVAVITEDGKNRILLVRSYRYLLNSVDWEVPAGACEKGEPVFAAARREVLEETGYRIRSLQKVYSFTPISGIGNLVFHVVRGCAGRKTGHPDPNEVREVRWFSRQELSGMIRRGQIRDGFSLAALLLVFINHRNAWKNAGVSF